jgi:hypothetical protein
MEASTSFRMLAAMGLSAVLITAAVVVARSRGATV